MESDSHERVLMRRLGWRLMPLLIVSFFFAILDRQNVGFVKAAMLVDLSISEAAFGLGASLFFIGYLLFEVPGALAIQRYGARFWMALMICAWGLVTLLLAFTESATMFYVLRFLLGVAQAGFYPGAIFYINSWFPDPYRIRMLGLFAMGSTLGNMLGGPINGPLLDLGSFLGLAGWQWVFVVSGVATILLTLIVAARLPSTWRTAPFLTEDERIRLETAHERQRPSNASHERPWAALWDTRVLGFSIVYTLMTTAFYGLTYWLPTVIQSFGVTATVNGLLNMVPWGLAAILLAIVPVLLRRDRVLFGVVIGLTLTGTLCFAASAVLTDNSQRFIALALGGPCIALLYPCFWTFPQRLFAGARAAASIAAINSIGNLGGFLAQNMMPWTSRLTGSVEGAMIVPSICLAILCVGAIAITVLRRPSIGESRRG